jgi:hypothetical protein
MPGGPIDPKCNAEEMFDQNTRMCANLVKHKGYSPTVHPPVPNGGFDFVFIDGDHNSPGFDNDVQFYFKHLARSAVFMGDDYSRRWQNIKDFLHLFAKQEKLVVNARGDKLWQLSSATAA